MPSMHRGYEGARHLMLLPGQWRRARLTTLLRDLLADAAR